MDAIQNRIIRQKRVRKRIFLLFLKMKLPFAIRNALNSLMKEGRIRAEKFVITKKYAEANMIIRRDKVS